VAVVVRANDAPRASDVLGVITKEHVADSVARSIGAYSSIIEIGPMRSNKREPESLTNPRGFLSSADFPFIETLYG
jgi:hypothetical protein